MFSFKQFTLIAAAGTFLILTPSCKRWNNQQKGAAVGVAAGAGTGAVIARLAKKNPAVGAIIGAAVGGTAGALIGRYMDKQAEEIRRDLPNAKVERVGEGIKITMNSGILFAYDSAELSDASKLALDDMAKTLNKYADTEILIQGHTDNSGTDAYNQRLSERRAANVSAYLRGEDVKRTRIKTTGFGESMPIADNATTTGREQNRRVEIAIMANDKLKKMAEQGKLETP
jgi:outer membrane protein OmpA-like peptidoglycan-associated protein